MPTKHGKADKGSQKWLQLLVNDYPELLNREIAKSGHFSINGIRWLSPRREDNYREYYDSAFIRELGLQLDNRPLNSFWPRGGPHWDALGRAGFRSSLLLEAKSHTGELSSGATGAKGASLDRIRDSLDRTKQYMGVRQSIDWAKSEYYQYANRLAHLYLLRVLNNLPAYLILLYFLNDVTQGGPSEIPEWEKAIAEEEEALGIRPGHKLSEFVVPVFFDINQIPVT